MRVCVCWWICNVECACLGGSRRPLTRYRRAKARKEKVRVWSGLFACVHGRAGGGGLIYFRCVYLYQYFGCSEGLIRYICAHHAPPCATLTPATTHALTPGLLCPRAERAARQRHARRRRCDRVSALTRNAVSARLACAWAWLATRCGLPAAAQRAWPRASPSWLIGQQCVRLSLLGRLALVPPGLKSRVRRV